MVFSERLEEVVDGTLRDDALKYLDGLQRAVSSMDILIEDLLRLSQISSQGSDFKTVDIGKLVDEVIDDLEATYPNARKSISLTNLPRVEADRTQMYQLFKNLLSNSLKYGKAEESTRISIDTETDVDQHILIFIRDNGIGFDEKYKEKIFRPFERLHSRNQYSGTGIGLAICKKVVEGHNGDISVQSQLNTGTIFTIRLPVSRNAS